MRVWDAPYAYILIWDCHAKIGSPKIGLGNQFWQKIWSPGPILAAKNGPHTQNRN